MGKQLNLAKVLTFKEKKLLFRLFAQEFKPESKVFKLDRKQHFIVDGEEITLSHSVGYHIDSISGEVIYAVYAYTYEPEQDSAIELVDEVTNSNPVPKHIRQNSNDVLGEGSFGLVKKVLSVFARNEHENSQDNLAQTLNPDFVVKIMREPDPSNALLRALWQQRVQSESKALSQTYQGVSAITYRNNEHNQALACYLMPFFSGLNGSQAIHQMQEQTLAERKNVHVNIQKQIEKFVKSLNIVVAISKALQRFHQDGFFHGDFKPSNIMISADGHNAFLIDFLSKKLGEEVNYIKSGEGDEKVAVPDLAFTAFYLAPEFFVEEAKVYESSADIYSLWLTIIQVLAGAPWYLEHETKKLPKINFPGDVDRFYEKECLKIMAERALNLDPTQRPTIDELIQFFTDMRARYLKKLDQHVANQLLPINQQEINEKKIAKVENPKLWQDKLVDLKNNIVSACEVIEAEKIRLIKKTYPNYEHLNSNSDINEIKLNSATDQNKLESFGRMQKELENKKNAIEELVLTKPENLTYRSLYKVTYQQVFNIINNNEYVNTLGRHQNIILKIINGTYKLLSRIFSNNQYNKMLGAEFTMPLSAKHLLTIEKTLQGNSQTPGIRR